MNKIRVAINGFGRIGRVFTRAAVLNPNIEIVAINDLTDAVTLAHLLKYDSVHRRFNGEVCAEGNFIIVNGNRIPVFAEKSPENLPWSKIGVDVVLESTGFFRSNREANAHLVAGAKRVVISAPPSSNDVPTFVLGINDNLLSAEDVIISNASCTTNCAAPLVKIVDAICGIKEGFITTVHSYTGDQRLHDAPHSDLRRARAAAESIVPTTTGAAKAITKIFPHLEGKMGGSGIRVPVANGSLTELTCMVSHPVDAQTLNEAFKKAADGELKGILEYTVDPIVSVDIISNPHSCIYDADLLSVIGNMVKVVGWYDNEAGYSHRLVDLIVKLKQF